MGTAKKGDDVTTEEASKRSGLTVRSINKAIEDGRLEASKFGREWNITIRALKAFMKRTDRKYKFSDEDVAELRRLWATKAFTQKQLSEQFHISQTHVQAIVSGKTRTKELK